MGSKRKVAKPKQKSEVDKIAFTVATPKEQYAM
jgi:hypothetical protein